MPPPTEQTLLSRYLLPPSSLPTILPYATFISLLPSSLASTAINDKKSPIATLIKRLYRDLQFQRDIDIDTVALNIQRDCQRSEVLRGRLRREVREELGYPVPPPTALPVKAESNGLKRKRGIDEEGDSTQSHGSTLSDAEDEEQDNTILSSTHPTTTTIATKPKPPFPNRTYNPLLSPHEVRLDTLFSGPRGLAPPPPPNPHQQYHTITSLLHSMQQSISTLESEINTLNNRSAEILEGMKETVGGMSDLRYGKFARVGVRSGDGTGEDGDEVVAGGRGGGGGVLEKEVAEALRELKQIVGRKTPAKGKGKGRGLER